ncbi:MAG: APC family permease [Vicinamibacteria bacterium]
MTRLTRQLGLGSATAAVVGQIIGVGIFLTPAAMAKAVGSPFWLLVAWLLMGVMALSGALCYGALGTRFPEAGGGYAYLREAWGERLAFLYGWQCLLVMDPGLTAALGTGVAAYVAVILPSTSGSQKAVAIGSVLALAAANAVGLRVGDGILRLVTLLKLGALGALVVWGFVGGAGSFSHFVPLVAQRPGSLPLLPAMGMATIGAFFSLAGWWTAANLGEEIRDAERVLPRALALGIGITTVTYILVSASFVYLVPMDAVASGETFAAQAGSALFGPIGATILAAVVILCVLGSLAAFQLLAPRVYYAMSRDGVFLQSIGQLHPRFGTPARAIAVQAVLASAFITLGTFDEIVAYFVFATVAFVALTVAGVFVIDRRAPAGESLRSRIWAYPVTPVVFLLLSGLVLALYAANRPWQAALGVLVVVLGAPVYEWVAASRRSKPAAAEGPA